MAAIEVDVVLEVSAASPSASPIASLKIGDWLAIWTGFGFFEVFGIFVASLVGSLVFDEREVEFEVVAAGYTKSGQTCLNSNIASLFATKLENQIE